MLAYATHAAEHVHGETIAIAFPDGESVQIKIRSSPEWRIVDKDEAPLAELYSQLRQEALAGDASAAFLLSTALNGCDFAYPDEVSMNEAIDHLRRTGELRAPGTAEPTPIRPGSDISQVEEDLFRRPFRFCRGISLEQRAESTTWLKMAAEQGHPGAAIAYARKLGRSNEAVRMYEIAWRDGKYDAAGQLAKLYEQGKGTERAPDAVKALAYYYLYNKITLHRLQGATTPIRSRGYELERQDLDSRMASAAPEVRDAAMRLAKQLLRENPNCCYGF